jgi:hypothetical protein
MKPLNSTIILGSQNIPILLHQEIISIWHGSTILMTINKYSYDPVRTVDCGKTFSKSLSLSNDSVNASKVNIYSNAKCVLIVWQQSNPPHSSIALRGGDDLGKPFGCETLHSEYSTSSYPKVFAGDYNVYISWNVDVDNRFNPNVIQEPEEVMGYEPGIYFVKSKDIGKSFSSPVRFAYDDTFDSGKSHVSVFDKCVYVTRYRRMR